MRIFILGGPSRPEASTLNLLVPASGGKAWHVRAANRLIQHVSPWSLGGTPSPELESWFCRFPVSVGTTFPCSHLQKTVHCADVDLLVTKGLCNQRVPCIYTCELRSSRSGQGILDPGLLQRMLIQRSVEDSGLPTPVLWLWIRGCSLAGQLWSRFLGVIPAGSVWSPILQSFSSWTCSCIFLY